MALGLVGLVSIFVIGACSPDLQEIAGPVIPYPNVTGQILRDGLPVDDHPVELEIRFEAGGDSAVADVYTTETGAYAFSAVGTGSWTIRVDSEDPEDFARVTYEFRFETADTSLVVPELDLSLKGMEIDEPDDGERLELPSLFSPVRFRWSRPESITGSMEVRVYDREGTPVWFSSETDAEEVRWNGLGNQGVYVGEAAPPGDYQWRIILDRDDAKQYRTGYRWFALEDR